MLHSMPGDPVVLEAVQPHVAVVETDPHTPRERLSLWGRELDAESTMIPEFGALRSELMEEFPGLTVFVGVRVDGKRDPVDLVGEAITDSGGVAKFSLRAVCHTEFCGPTRISLVGQSKGTGGAILATLDRRFEELRQSLRLRAWRKDGRGGFIKLSIGGSCPVPAGTYEVSLGPSWIGKLVSPVIVDVVPGVEARVHLSPTRPFRSVVFRTSVPDGLSVPGVQLLALDKAKERDRTQASFVGPWKGSCQLLLPEGQYDIRVTTQHFERLVSPLTIPSGFGDPLSVVLKLTPKKGNDE
jgi:hypothetical protein